MTTPSDLANIDGYGSDLRAHVRGVLTAAALRIADAEMAPREGRPSWQSGELVAAMLYFDPANGRDGHLDQKLRRRAENPCGFASVDLADAVAVLDLVDEVDDLMARLAILLDPEASA